MTDEPQRSRGPLIALLAAVALVIVLALIAVFARGGTVAYAEDSPEGVVQRYTQAVIDGDTRTALTHLVPEVADECERQPVGPDDYRVTLLKTTERDDSARLDVMLSTVYDSGLFGSSEYSTEEAFDLVRIDGTWYIDVAPWQFTVCLNGGMR